MEKLVWNLYPVIDLLGYLYELVVKFASRCKLNLISPSLKM